MASAVESSLTGRLHPRHDWSALFDQGEVWVDAQRREHAIARMSPDYVANVIDFCARELEWMDVELTGPLAETPLIEALHKRLVLARLAEAQPRPVRVEEPLAATPRSVALTGNGGLAGGL